ncbi:MAG: hypothetical protein DI584_01515 [Stenotrophomonas sp.]|nr:MAG: hypothetical protein DI584_01515 [Stenotrophomonas sp.]
MPQDQTPKVSRWAHYKRIKAWRYVALSIAAIAFFAWLSIAKGDWAYLERSGGIIALLGAFLGLRKLFRKGARDLNTPNEPLTKGQQFDVQAMWHEVEDLSDSFAEELGLFLAVLGTLISTAGAPLLQ